MGTMSSVQDGRGDRRGVIDRTTPQARYAMSTLGAEEQGRCSGSSSVPPDEVELYLAGTADFGRALPNKDSDGTLNFENLSLQGTAEFGYGGFNSTAEFGASVMGAIAEDFSSPLGNNFAQQSEFAGSLGQTADFGVAVAASQPREESDELAGTAEFGAAAAGDEPLADTTGTGSFGHGTLTSGDTLKLGEEELTVCTSDSGFALGGGGLGDTASFGDAAGTMGDTASFGGDAVLDATDCDDSFRPAMS